MTGVDSDKVFAGSIPKIYDELLVPLIFARFAEDLAARVAARSPAHVLEVAAGTGVVTRRLASVLAPHASIVATDLNHAMLEQAAAVGTARPVQWRDADAQQLPFADGEFDAVVCQFGVMFFPDRPKAYAEARRVLRPGGVFAFNVWGRIEDNEFADTVTTALQRLYPQDPPRFMVRTPHGYHDAARIRADLEAAGFVGSPRIDTLTAISRAASAQQAATAYCQGTPLRSEIEARPGVSLADATAAAARAIAERFGSGAVEGKLQAHVVLVER